MPWIIAIIAGLVLGAILISSRAARGVLIAVAALLAVGAIWLIYTDSSREYRAQTLIDVDEVELRQPLVDQRGGLYYLITSVKNLSSEHAIKSLKIQILAHDCPSDALTEECDIVGDETASLRVRVPAGQVRGVEELSTFANLPPVRTMLWTFSVIEVRAEVQ
jgi:hypothetical protein